MAAAVASAPSSHFSSHMSGSSPSSLAANSQGAYNPYSIFDNLDQLSKEEQSAFVLHTLRALDQWLKLQDKDSSGSASTSKEPTRRLDTLGTNGSSVDTANFTDSSTNASASVTSAASASAASATSLTGTNTSANSTAAATSTETTTDATSADLAAKFAVAVQNRKVFEQQQKDTMTDTGLSRPKHHLTDWKTKSALSTNKKTSRVGTSQTTSKPKKSVTWAELPVPDVCTNKFADPLKRMLARNAYRKKEGWTKADDTEKSARKSGQSRPKSRSRRRLRR